MQSSSGPTLKHRTHPPTHPHLLAPSPQQMSHHSDAVGAGDGAEPLARTVLPGMGLRGGLGSVLGCCRPLNQLRHQGTTLQAKQRNTRKRTGLNRSIALVSVNNCMVAADTVVERQQSVHLGLSCSRWPTRTRSWLHDDTAMSRAGARKGARFAAMSLVMTSLNTLATISSPGVRTELHIGGKRQGRPRHTTCVSRSVVRRVKEAHIALSGSLCPTLCRTCFSEGSGQHCSEPSPTCLGHVPQGRH